ncbi:MAG TPA: 16S rRNA (adenine(1518)-N(6)/adenine(1519)-N(6))-dimethyltransferase RsmA [Acidobacteriota bacterium]|nr:16S rRNA (adenine(1518)-N(6)/adenine(1519)-N(6))-dimethyltransferase RsmA [Acidobacteriota bacterium]
MGVTSRLVKLNAPIPKKRFGQHFLRDRGVIDRIVRWIQPSPNDIFLEIGAGDGALSQCIAPGVSSLLAIELDTDCIPPLQNALAGFPSAAVIEGDILQLDLRQIVSPCLTPGAKLRVTGNLPYNISTVIIDKLLNLDLPIEDMTFMVQLEVAQRITAVPATRDYGYFSLVCQHRADVRLGFKVSPACFVPRPKVSSATVSFRLKPKTWDETMEADFQMLGKAAFGYRRKTLENSLSRHAVAGKVTSLLLTRAGIDGWRRAEELSVQEYEHLAQTFHILKL